MCVVHKRRPRRKGTVSVGQLELASILLSVGQLSWTLELESLTRISTKEDFEQEEPIGKPANVTGSRLPRRKGTGGPESGSSQRRRRRDPARRGREGDSGAGSAANEALITSDESAGSSSSGDDEAGGSRSTEELVVVNEEDRPPPPPRRQSPRRRRCPPPKPTDATESAGNTRGKVDEGHSRGDPWAIGRRWRPGLEAEIADNTRGNVGVEIRRGGGPWTGVLVHGVVERSSGNTRGKVDEGHSRGDPWAIGRRSRPGLDAEIAGNTLVSPRPTPEMSPINLTGVRIVIDRTGSDDTEPTVVLSSSASAPAGGEQGGRRPTKIDKDSAVAADAEAEAALRMSHSVSASSGLCQSPTSVTPNSNSQVFLLDDMA